MCSSDLADGKHTLGCSEVTVLQTPIENRLLTSRSCTRPLVINMLHRLLFVSTPVMSPVASHIPFAMAPVHASPNHVLQTSPSPCFRRNCSRPCYTRCSVNTPRLFEKQDSTELDDMMEMLRERRVSSGKSRAEFS